MPRIKRFEELPGWLRQRIRTDWDNLCRPAPGSPDVPPIRDPEYRVYRIDRDGVATGWWSIDAGTGGVSVESEFESHAYGDLRPNDPIKALVDAEGRRCRDASHVEMMYEIVRGRGADAQACGTAITRWRGDGLDDEAVFWQLVASLEGFKRTGDWEF